MDGGTSELSSFGHDHDGERLSGGYGGGGDGGADPPTVVLPHGAGDGLRFRDRYEAHGGRPLADGPDHLYRRLLDALAYAPDAAGLAGPWHELGRTDLTEEVLGDRPEAYVRGLLEHHG